MTTTLIDAVDTRRRLLQNLLMLTGILLLMGSLLFFKAAGDGKTNAGGWLTLASGFAAFAVAFTTKVRWQVDCMGHRIVFENDPFRGERLFVDGAAVAKGRLGIRNTLTASLPEGDRISATTVAALASFRCKIVAEPAVDAAWSAAPESARAISFE